MGAYVCMRVWVQVDSANGSANGQKSGAAGWVGKTNNHFHSMIMTMAYKPGLSLTCQINNKY